MMRRPAPTGRADLAGPLSAARVRDQDIETARAFYADLLAFEWRMEQAEGHMFNRGRWIEAESHIRKAREPLEHFIGERMTADLVTHAYEQQRAEEEKAERERGADGQPDAPEGDEQ